MSISKSRISGIRGSLAEFRGNDPDILSLPHLCQPAVAVIAAAKPVRFEVSLDGVEFVPARDKDGVELRVTKPGVYRIPAPVLFVRPVSTDPNLHLQIFIGATHE